MAQFTIEAFTIVTAVAICIILAVYLFVLKKNGWLGAGSKVYLCPNLECKKIFQKPVELKDLSETPARMYPACPHCGTNLESVLASCVKKKSKLEANIPRQQNKTEIKLEDSDSILKDYLNTHRNSTKESNSFVNVNSEDPIKIEIRKPDVAVQVESSYKKPSKSVSEKTTVPEPVHSLQPRKMELTPSTPEQKLETRTVSPSSSGCQYGYGYLSTREKDEGIPDTCVECPKSLDCMLAEYYKKRDSVKEIKKWYNF